MERNYKDSYQLEPYKDELKEKKHFQSYCDGAN